MSIHEECGVFGIISPQPENVANIVGFGMACELIKSRQREALLHTSILKQVL